MVKLIKFGAGGTFLLQAYTVEKLAYDLCTGKNQDGPFTL